jgi:hypothetical protein
METNCCLKEAIAIAQGSTVMTIYIRLYLGRGQWQWF